MARNIILFLYLDPLHTLVLIYLSLHLDMFFCLLFFKLKEGGGCFYEGKSWVSGEEKSFLSTVGAFSFASCLSICTSIHSPCPTKACCIMIWFQLQYLAKIYFWHWLFEGQKPSGILSSNMATLIPFLASLNLLLINMEATLRLPLNLISVTMSVTE